MNLQAYSDLCAKMAKSLARKVDDHSLTDEMRAQLAEAASSLLRAKVMISRARRTVESDQVA